MFRSSLQRFTVPFTRSYSQGFDISQYLSRIEAATKKPLKPFEKKQAAGAKNTKGAQSQGKKPAAGAKAGPAGAKNAGAKNAGAKASGAKPGQRTGPKRAPRNAPKQASASEAKDASAPASASASASASARASAPSARASAPASGEFSVETSEWSTLDSAVTPSSVPRGNRRPRKAGSRTRTAQRQTRAKPSGPKRVGASAPVDDRSYKPYLSPQEALGVVLRNEGTSSGGFIAPFDVSLSSLQPNLVSSAVTYNTRVRSLLNAIPASGFEEAQKEELVNLAKKYVSGDFSRAQAMEKAQSLSAQGLLSEVNQNSSLDAQTRQFLADVGSGRVTPKQVIQAGTR